MANLNDIAVLQLMLVYGDIVNTCAAPALDVKERVAAEALAQLQVMPRYEGVLDDDVVAFGAPDIYY